MSDTHPGKNPNPNPKNGGTGQAAHTTVDPVAARLAEEAQKCMKCGLCQAVCPVYREVRGESSVARGRISLVEAALNGRIRWSPLMEDRLSTCLVCQACLAGCPSGVRIDRLMVDARTIVAKNVRTPLVKRLALRKLLREGRLDGYVKFGRRFQRLALRPRGRGLHAPAFALDRRRLLPSLSKQTLYEDPSVARLPDGTPVLADPAGGTTPRGDLTFFPGCLITYVYPQIGLAAGRVLGALGYRVLLPREPVCCGEPALLNGDKETAQTLAARLRASLPQGTATLVTACASCGTMLKKEYPELEMRPEESTAGGGAAGAVPAEGGAPPPRTADLGVPILDITELLASDGNLDRLEALGAFPGGGTGAKVTYHDPCHLKHSRGITAPPRQLLRRMAGDSFVEMKESACCGSGGTFSLRHYALTRKIGRRQAQLIAGTGAGTVATACPGCIMQTNENLANAGKEARARHIIELIDESMSSRK